jgi:hypothetical protein
MQNVRVPGIAATHPSQFFTKNDRYKYYRKAKETRKNNSFITFESNFHLHKNTLLLKSGMDHQNNYCSDRPGDES